MMQFNSCIQLISEVMWASLTSCKRRMTEFERCTCSQTETTRNVYHEFHIIDVSQWDSLTSQDCKIIQLESRTPVLDQTAQYEFWTSLRDMATYTSEKDQSHAV